MAEVSISGFRFFIYSPTVNHTIFQVYNVHWKGRIKNTWKKSTWRTWKVMADEMTQISQSLF